MGLKEQINEDMKAAMKARQSERLSALRLLIAAVRQKEIDERKVLDDLAVVSVIERLSAAIRSSTFRPLAALTWWKRNPPSWSC